MKSFLKYTLAAFIGAGLAFLAFFIFTFLVGAVALGSAADQSSKGKPLKEASILSLDLNSAMPERKNNVESDKMSFETDDVYGFYDMVKGIRKAKESSKIKGIYIDATQAAVGHTQLMNLVDELEDFKESGKFVYAFATGFTQHGYVLATVADSIFMHPLGLVELKGYAAVVPYYNGLREKLSIDVDIFNTGDFKSHGENYIKDKMSDANRQQTRQYLLEIKENLIETISANRNLSQEKVDQLNDGFLITRAETAVSEGLVDVIAYGHEVNEHMRTKMGIEEDDKLPLVDLSTWLGSTSLKQGSGDAKIALVFAEGTIMDNSDQKGIISDKVYVPILDKIAENDDIKAVVLRVNSGGGSVYSSDNIHAAIQRIKDSGKKVVTSMGDVAASGGYYISMNSDHIFAEESTITGSIGVVSMIPNFTRSLKENLGVTFDTVKTDPMADGFSPVLPWSQNERDLFQGMLDDFYATFLGKVADGRSMEVEDVKKIAGGRVWTGEKALGLGLVDELGGLEDAIAKAKELAEMDGYKIEEYPKFQAPLMELLESFNNNSDALAQYKKVVVQTIPELESTINMMDGGKFQFVLPLELRY